MNMKQLQNFYLFEGRKKHSANDTSETEQVIVRAEIKNNCLKITSRVIDYGWGKYAFEMEGGSTYNFDEENTKRLIMLLTQEDRDFKEALIKNFAGFDLHGKLEEYCRLNNIEYEVIWGKLDDKNF